MDWNLFTGERAGTDALLLADFAKDAHGTYGADLGCGSGILLLLLLLGDESRRMTGVDIRESAAASARENLRAFALEERGEAVCAVLSEKLPTPVRRVGVQDVFGCSGPAWDLLKFYGLDAATICKTAHEMLGK